jgi:hypothetical protein
MVAGVIVVLLAALVLGFYAVGRIEPGRFRLSLRLLKLFALEVEVDAQRRPDAEDKPDELPPSNSVQSPDGRPSGPPRAARTGNPGQDGPKELP